MALPINENFIDSALTTQLTAITGGATSSIGSPFRGEIVGVLLVPVGGGAITGSATLTFTVANVSGATVAMAASSAGFASGAAQATGVTLSARQFVNEGDCITAALGSGLTGTGVGILTILIRRRTI